MFKADNFLVGLMHLIVSTVCLICVSIPILLSIELLSHMDKRTAWEGVGVFLGSVFLVMISLTIIYLFGKSIRDTYEEEYFNG